MRKRLIPERQLKLSLVRELLDMAQEEGHDPIGEAHIADDAQTSIGTRYEAIQNRAVEMHKHSRQDEKAQLFHRGKKRWK